MIEIVLAGAPRGKERVKVAADGHSYTPERTVSFEGRLAYAAQIAMAGRPPLEGPLAIEFQMFMPVPVAWSKKKREAALRGEILPTVKPDFDNGAKCIDALNLIVWIDDRQIVDAHIRKRYSDRPRTEVRVSPAIGENDADEHGRPQGERGVLREAGPGAADIFG